MHKGESTLDNNTPFNPEAGSHWYVQQAGIVLLHPFLSRYFDRCQLLKKGHFLDEPARHKAVHLVEYLATGATGIPEYELVLPKFLCGIPFNLPLERAPIITEDDRQAGEELLQAAIDHWEKLGNSSPTGLREGFLQREGKLEKREQGWYLLVEQKGTDILLDYLPWNIRMVKLPWMTDLLRVEWG